MPTDMCPKIRVHKWCQHPSFSPTLIFHHLLDEGSSFINVERKECTSSCGIYVPLRHGCEPLIEILKHEPIFHPVVGAGPDVLLEPFRSLRNGFE